jgi:hypothetical protein
VLGPENGRRRSGQAAKRLSIINKPNPRRPDIAFSSYRVSHRDIQDRRERSELRQWRERPAATGRAAAGQTLPAKRGSRGMPAIAMLLDRPAPAIFSSVKMAT